jgi:hypothetical protein
MRGGGVIVCVPDVGKVAVISEVSYLMEIKGK